MKWGKSYRWYEAKQQVNYIFQNGLYNYNNFREQRCKQDLIYEGVRCCYIFSIGVVRNLPLTDLYKLLLPRQQSHLVCNLVVSTTHCDDDSRTID